MKTKVNIKCLVVICTCILLVVVTGVFVKAGPKKRTGLEKDLEEGRMVLAVRKPLFL